MTDTPHIPDHWAPVPGNHPGDHTITLEELAANPQWRGQYRHDIDTRAFVIEHEAKCQAWNCWMVRDAEGAPQYISAPPEIHFTPGP